MMGHYTIRARNPCFPGDGIKGFVPVAQSCCFFSHIVSELDPSYRVSNLDYARAQ